MRLIWNKTQGLGVINNGNKEWPIIAAPVVAFSFDGLWFDDERGYYLHLRDGGGQTPLTDDEKAQILAWIAQQDEPQESGPNPIDVQNEIVNAVQQHLDAVARTRSYDGILSLCTYATSTVPQFAAEGQAGVEWRDAVWAYCYQVLADVQAELRPIPTPAELILELPAMVWPS